MTNSSPSNTSVLPSFDLHDKVAMITGGSTGIGRHLADVYAAAGAQVVVTSRSEATAQDVADQLRANGATALGVQLEVGSVESIRSAFAQVREEFARIDVLLNNAGTFHRTPSIDVTEAEWDGVVDTYLKGLFFCSQEAGRVMLPHGAGKIINVSSQMAFVALPGRAAYCAAKAGVVHLTRVLAQEWAPNNVQVNAIAPTFTVVRKPSSAADPAFHEFVLQHIPLGRMAEPRDLAGAALFLATAASDFVTGHTLVVDGGWLTL